MKWTRRLSTRKRNELSNHVLEQRFLQTRHNTLMYSARRNLEHIQKEVDLVGILRKRLSLIKRPLRFLDSGAGLGNVSAGLKKEFGEQVNVTALTLRGLNISTKTKRASISHAKENPTYYYPFPVEERKEMGEKMSKSQRESIDLARKNSQIIDNVKVGLLENLPTRKKYDIIFDYSGPLQHSTSKKRVAEQYAKLLPKGGLLITIKKSYLSKSFNVKRKFKVISEGKKHVLLERI